MKKNRYKKAAALAEKYFEDRQLDIEKERSARIGRAKKAMNAFLKMFPAVEKVVIVGSTTKPHFFRSDSDMDIVVKGLKVASIFKAASFLEKKLSLSLDLIPWEDVPPKKMKFVEEGKVIYERKQPDSH